MSIKNFGNGDMREITLFEQAYDVQLPNDYIEFLLFSNGGVITPDANCAVFVKYLEQHVHIDVLYGIHTSEPQLDLKWRMQKYQDEILPDAVIIGDSHEHGLIILLCSGDDAGVYYWDHTREFSCSNDDSNTYFIADTFSDFIKGLL
jgi:hypothetical protein